MRDRTKLTSFRDAKGHLQAQIDWSRPVLIIGERGKLTEYDLTPYLHLIADKLLIDAGQVPENMLS